MYIVEVGFVQIS